MSALPFSAELAASVARMRDRTWIDQKAAAFETGRARTKPAGGISSRFTPRQRPRSPDREASRNRRRMLGGSSALPNNLRHHYTEGQRSVLCIVGGEIKRHGFCDMPIDKIAALAGVCRTSVQTVLHEARRLGHVRITERPQPGRKHLPSIVKIISAEWLAWLKRGPSIPSLIGSNSLNLMSTTKRQADRQEVFEEEKSRHPWPPATCGPPDQRRRA